MNFVNAGFTGTKSPLLPDMNAQVEDPAQEVKRLQRCINDLIGLLALPAVWSGNESSQIVEMLLDALLRMLSLDFAYGRLKDPLTTVPSEIFRVADSCTLKVPQQDVSVMLRNWLKRDGDSSLSLTASQFGAGNISVFQVPLGLQGEIGLIAVGSERADFPTQTESLLLRVAANQASIGLREAELLREQKRIAGELDRRVAERTAELAAAYGELRRTEERWRSVFDNSAVGVALTDLNGQFIATNFVFQKMLRYTEGELRQLTLLDITHEENVKEIRTLIGELIDGKRQQFQIEFGRCFPRRGQSASAAWFTASPNPCSNPQIRNVQDAPCQSPPNANVTSVFQ